MSKPTLFYPALRVDQTAGGVVSQAVGVVLIETVRRAGLDRVPSQALSPWRPRWAVHDPGKVLLDLAMSLAVGGNCLVDVAVLRAEPAVFGSVASDPTVSPRSTGSAPTLTACWLRSARRHRWCGNTCGPWRVSGHRFMRPRPMRRWSSIWMPRW
jgi:hypothetical protein